MTGHIEDLAELYALGSLDDPERERVDRHVSGCAPCAQRLCEAEDAVTEIALAQAFHKAPPRLGRRLSGSIGQAMPRHRTFAVPAAIAAALILALVPTWISIDNNRTANLAMRQDEAALAKIASAPFGRAQFMSPGKRPMNAKVLYGMHGDWYYVVVMHPRPGMQVAYVHGGKMQMLGRVAMHGASGTLYLPVNHKMDELALLAGGTVLADAHLAY